VNSRGRPEHRNRHRHTCRLVARRAHPLWQRLRVERQHGMYAYENAKHRFFFVDHDAPVLDCKPRVLVAQSARPRHRLFDRKEFAVRAWHVHHQLGIKCPPQGWQPGAQGASRRVRFLVTGQGPRTMSVKNKNASRPHSGRQTSLATSTGPPGAPSPLDTEPPRPPSLATLILTSLCIPTPCP
jgi:hypothetical protein